MDEEDPGRIEVLTKDDADERTMEIAMKLDTIFNSELFEKIVRDTVADMLQEGKLEYDMYRDVFDTPLNNAKEFSIRWLSEQGDHLSSK